MVKSLISEGCRIQAYDPAGADNAREILGTQDIEYVPSALDAAKNADALLVLTDWEEFRAIDLKELHQLLRYPIVIDGRNMFDPSAMAEHGFIYTSVGRADVPHDTSAARNGNGSGQRAALRIPVSQVIKSN